MGKRIYFISIVFCLASFHTATAGGLEFRITFSGKVLLGLAYRHQFDPNTAWRLGAFIGMTGAPVGLHTSLVQDVAPLEPWTPVFSLGVDAVFLRHQRLTPQFYPSATAGLTYCPAAHLKHSVELWLGWLSGDIHPIGLSYIHFNSVN